IVKHVPIALVVIYIDARLFRIGRLDSGYAHRAVMRYRNRRDMCSIKINDMDGTADAAKYQEPIAVQRHVVDAVSNADRPYQLVVLDKSRLPVVSAT
ncbi:hypothetical protein PQR02_40515, partial [Paraburkholderia sediminicola]|uniref:hypothetical protein n=1 Tax=Paraburkholderia sediminicola TaxID=458836 RepID=UPI0038BDCE48